MGAVYEVVDPAGGQLALKVVLDNSNAEMVKRFTREAKAAASLTSDHSARVFASGVLEDGTPYMVMELLRGQDLDQYLEEHGLLASDDAIEVVKQICHALEEAHELGMVHRDVKPANIFVRRHSNGRLTAKLLDFGVSKAALTDMAPVTQLTQTGTILGSPHYMSPEQLVSSSDVDQRADVWSLGATLHEMLTGVGPFDHPTVAEVLSAVLRDPPTSIREHNPDVPEALEKIVLRCLEKDPEIRYATVAELEAALRALSPATPVQAPREVSSPSKDEERKVPVVKAPAHPAAARWPWALGVVLVIGIAATLFLMLRTGDEPPLAPGDDFAGADHELDASTQEQVAAKLRSAFRKFQAKELEEAHRAAADAEGLLRDAGLSPGAHISRMGQDAAIIQARVAAEDVVMLVQSATEDDDPLPLIASVKQLLQEERGHAKRATKWDPEAVRCIRSAPVFTMQKVLAAWSAYVQRLPKAKRKVAANYEKALELKVRAAFDRLVHAGSDVPDVCRKRVEQGRRATSR